MPLGRFTCQDGGWRLRKNLRKNHATSLSFLLPSRSGKILAAKRRKFYLVFRSWYSYASIIHVKKVWFRVLNTRLFIHDSGNDLNTWKVKVRRMSGIFAHRCKIWINPVPNRTYLNILIYLTSHNRPNRLHIIGSSIRSIRRLGLSDSCRQRAT